MSAPSVVTVPCDRCGRLPADEAAETPFSFCVSCGLFVCSSCWSGGQSVCDACAATRDAAPAAARDTARPAAEPPSRRKARAAQRASRRRSAPGLAANGKSHVTSLHPSGEVVINPRPAAPVAAPAAHDLTAVGPGAPAAAETPPWARRLPDPFVVRLANWITDGHAFGLIVATLVGLAVIAGAWALAAGVRLDPEAPAVLPPVQQSQPATQPSSAEATTAASPTPAPTASPRRYFVRSGDTLARIAGRVYGDESLWPVILEANRETIGDADNLVIGTSLWIPARPTS